MAAESEVVIGGDVRGYQAALGQAEAAQERWASSAADSTAKLEQLEQATREVTDAMTKLAREQAEALADNASRDFAAHMREAAAAGEDTAKAGKRLAEVRTADADALQHQIQVLRALGADQAEILHLVEAEKALRAQAAELSGNEARAVEQLRKSELAHAQAVRQQQEAQAQALRENGQLRAQELRAQAAQERRASELVVQTDEQKLATQRKILDLERQALTVEHQQARTRAEQLAIEEKLAENAHERVKLERQAQAEAQEGTSKVGAGVVALRGHWMAVVGAVAAFTAGMQAADEVMAQTLAQRTMASNLPFQIDAAREATLHLVSDFELSQKAIEAQRLKVVQTEDGFAQLAEAATVLGMSVGVDATRSIGNLVGALGRGETELLDNLGVFLRAAEAQNLYAARLGTTRSALTDVQKAEAFRTIGLERALAAAEKVKLELNESEKSWVGAKRGIDALVRDSLPQIEERLDGLWGIVGEGTELVADLVPALAIYADGLITGLKPVVWVVGVIAEGLGSLVRIVEWGAEKFMAGAEAIGEFAGAARDWLADTWVGDAASWVADTGAAVLDFASNALDSLGDALGDNIPITHELALEAEALGRAITGASAAAGSISINPARELNALFAAGKALADQRAAAEGEAVAALEQQVTSAGEAVELAKAQGAGQANVERLLRAQHEAHVRLLRAQGEDEKLAKAIAEEQVRRVTASRAGLTDAQAFVVFGQERLQQLREELELEQQRAREQAEQAEQAEALAAAQLDARRVALEAERDSLLVREAGSSAEQEDIDARLLAVEGELAQTEALAELAARRRAEEQAIAAAAGETASAGKVAEATDLARQVALQEQVNSLDHQIKLAEAQGKPTREVERLLRQQYDARLQLLQAQGLEVEASKLIADEEIRRAKVAAAGKGKGPTEAERVAAAGKIRIAMLEDELALLELRSTAERAGLDSASDAERAAERALAIKLAELDVERDTLLATKAKNSLERETIAARLEGIERERALAVGSADLEARQRARELEHASAVERLGDLDREIERLAALGVATQLLQRQRDDAQLALLEQFGTREQLADFEQARVVAEIENRRAMEVERRELALEAFEWDVELREAEGEHIRSLADERFELEYALAQAAGDTDGMREAIHKRDLARIRERVEAERRAQQLTRGLLQSGGELAGLIVENAIKDDAKREKAALRLRGVMALATAALETVEGAAAIARYDYVAAALHFAAATVGFVQGGLMIAGRVPSQGGGSGSGAGGSGGAGSGAGTFGDGVGQSTAPRDPPPVPLSTDDGSAGRGAAKGEGNQAGATIININAPMVTNDSSKLLEGIDRRAGSGWGA